MRAEIRSLRTAGYFVLDSGLSLEEWQPDDPECFGVYIEAEIGPRDDVGEEVFGFYICSPKWLQQQEQRGKGYLWLRHHLLMWQWDYALAYQALEELVRRFEEPDWTSVAEKLARYTHWEFEDYSGLKQ